MSVRDDLAAAMQALRASAPATADAALNSLATTLGTYLAFVQVGVAVARPVSGAAPLHLYFATDTNVLSLWTGSAWKTAVFA